MGNQHSTYPSFETRQSGPIADLSDETATDLQHVPGPGRTLAWTTLIRSRLLTANRSLSPIRKPSFCKNVQDRCFIWE